MSTWKTAFCFIPTVQIKRQLWIVSLILGVAPVALTAESNLQRDLLLASQDIQAGRYEAAAGILRPVSQTNPSNPDFWNLLGIAETETGEHDSAERAFKRGLQLAPQSVSLYENIGLLYFRESRYPNAKKALTHAVELGSSQPSVRFSLAGAKLRTGESVAALRDLRTLESSLLASPAYWEERGRAELIVSPAEAQKSFERALELAPDSIAALDGAANSAERSGSDEEALKYLIKAHTLTPEDAAISLHFASVCIRRDLGPDAIAALGDVVRSQPANSEALYLLARAHISVGDWQRAHDLFSEFAKRSPKYAPAYYALGWLDIRLGRTAEAARDLEHCLVLDPSQMDAKFELAQLAYDDGRTDIAEKLASAVLTKKPHHAKANLLMGKIALRQGDLSRALQLTQLAEETDPHSSAAHYQLSQLYARTHDPAKAAEEARLAATLTAENDRESKIQLRLVLPDRRPAP